MATFLQNKMSVAIRKHQYMFKVNNTTLLVAPLLKSIAKLTENINFILSIIFSLIFFFKVCLAWGKNRGEIFMDTIYV